MSITWKTLPLTGWTLAQLSTQSLFIHPFYDVNNEKRRKFSQKCLRLLWRSIKFSSFATSKCLENLLSELTIAKIDGEVTRDRETTALSRLEASRLSLWIAFKLITAWAKQIHPSPGSSSFPGPAAACWIMHGTTCCERHSTTNLAAGEEDKNGLQPARKPETEMGACSVQN